MLDGGLPHWRSLSLPLESGAPPATPPARFSATLQPRLIASLADVRTAAATQSAAILDARPRGRWAGIDPEPRAGLPSGHVPTSVSLPFSAVLTPDGTRFKQPDELRAMFDALGVGKERKSIFTCGSGVTACVIEMAALIAGGEEGSVYDGAWAEYGSQKDAIIATEK